MQVDALSIALAPSEVSALLLSLPLPEGIRLGDATLKDDGLEVTVKASFLLGLPVKFKIQIQSYAGSRVSLKVMPPIKPNWLVVRPMVASMPGAVYAGHSVIEVDLAALSKGYLSSGLIQKITLNKNGLRIEASSLKSKVSWEEVIRKLP